MKKFKYSILTQIMDIDYEYPREIQDKDENVEYIIVTGDKRLTSKTWTVIYDERFSNMSIYNALSYVRFNPFEFIHSDICIHVTGAIQIQKSLDKLVNDFLFSNANVGLIVHPCCSTFQQDIQLFVNQKRYTIDQANNFLKLLNDTKYDLNYKSYFILTMFMQKRSKQVFDMNRLTLSFLHYLGDEKQIDNIDQFAFAYVINTFFKDINIFKMSIQVIHSSYLQLYNHHSEVKAGTIDLTNDKHFGYCFNKLIECYKIQ